MSEENTQPIIKKKTFWIIGLTTMITIALNGNIIFPLGLGILGVITIFKKKYQTILKENIKKVLIAIIIGLVLGFGGMGLIVNIEHTQQKNGINFSLQLLPSKLLNPIIGLFIDEQKMQNKIITKIEDNVSNGESAGCNIIRKDFITQWNSNNFTGLANTFYQDQSVEEDKKVVVEKLPKLRDFVGPLSGQDLIGWNLLFESENKKIETTTRSYTQENKELNIQIDCILNQKTNTRERYYVNFSEVQ